ARAAPRRLLPARSRFGVPCVLEQGAGRCVVEIPDRGRQGPEPCKARPRQGCRDRDRVGPCRHGRYTSGGDARMTDNNRKEDENLGSFYMGRMRPPPEPERILPRGLLTAIVVFAFAGILWYAYPQGAEKYTDVDVPVVKAEVSPYKFAPEDPGGMEVRHRDSTVFDSLETAPVKKVEKILPAGEAPLDRKTVLGETSPALNLDPQLKDTVTA